MMRIIYVNAPARTGKDTFCDLCKEFIDCKVISTVDRVKEIAKDYLGWDGVKDDKGRKLLAAIRYAWGEYNMGPIAEVGKTIQNSKTLDVLFVMVREYGEMIKMQEMYGGACLTVHRDVHVCATEQKFLDEIPSDFVWDFHIDNSGTLSELKSNASMFCLYSLQPSLY